MTRLAAPVAFQYSYDAASRFQGGSAFGSPPGNGVSFTYDARNRILVATVNSVATYRIYDGWNLIADYNASGALTTRYVHGPNIDEILVKIDGSGPKYYHENGLGSVVALTDATKAVVERYAYSVYGVPKYQNGAGSTISASAHGNRFLFTGREYFQNIRLYDYRNRAYSPFIGRFLQTDPIWFEAGDVNLYRYVKNCPINLTDSYGLAAGKMGYCTGLAARFSALVEEQTKAMDRFSEFTEGAKKRYAECIESCKGLCPAAEAECLKGCEKQRKRDFETASQLYQEALSLGAKARDVSDSYTRMGCPGILD